MTLVVGEFDDRVVIIPVDDARRLATLHEALGSASTWGELVHAVGSDEVLLNEIRERYGDDLPGSTEPFRLDDIPGCTEGDWPASPAELMVGVLPASIAELGAACPTLFGADLMQIAPAFLPEVRRRLQQLGIRFSEDDSLVHRACGAWRYG